MVDGGSRNGHGGGDEEYNYLNFLKNRRKKMQERKEVQFESEGSEVVVD